MVIGVKDQLTQNRLQWRLLRFVGAVGEPPLPSRYAAALVGLVAFIAYLRTMAPSAATGDGYEFQVAGARLGVVHPTGYPLYTILSWLATLLPFGEIGWRVNLLSAISAAIVVWLTALIIYELTESTPASVAGGLLLAFSLTLWKQAVIAEKYSFHLLLVSALVMLAIKWLRAIDRDNRQAVSRYTVLLGLTAGLSLAHHRMTLIALAAIGIVLAGAALRGRRWQRLSLLALLLAALAFVLPLGLYAYIPLRWPMTWQQFVTQVMGSEYQGAGRWLSWVEDTARLKLYLYLVSRQFGLPWLLVGLVGLAYLLRRNWPAALILGLLGAFSFFFALDWYSSYNDPNYLLPTYLTLAIAIGCGIAFAVKLASALFQKLSMGVYLRSSVISVVLVALVVIQYATNVGEADASGFTRHLRWADRGLAQQPASGALILASGPPFAGLDYLVSVRGLRPDLVVSDVPTLATTIKQVESALAKGQSVYLARPIYGVGGLHYNMAGPLIEVRRQPPLADENAKAIARFGDRFELTDVSVEQVEPDLLAMKLGWRAIQPAGGSYRFRSRLVDEAGQVWAQEIGGLPLLGNYPTDRWPVGSIIHDYRELQLPPGLPEGLYLLQVGAFLDFHRDGLPAGQGDWVTAVAIELKPTHQQLPAGAVITDVNFGDTLKLAGYKLNGPIEAGADLTVDLYWRAGAHPTDDLRFEVKLVDEADRVLATDAERFVPPMSSAAPRLRLTRSELTAPADAGGKVRLEVRVVGAAAPTSATYRSDPYQVEPAHPQRDDDVRLPALFDGELWLDQVEINTPQITTGDYAVVTLNWRVFQRPAEDYTAFIQLIGPNGRLAQRDYPPLYGTWPTSNWLAGQRFRDRHRVSTPFDLPAGEYRVIVGLYRGWDLMRLLILDQHRRGVADQIEVGTIRISGR